MQNSTTEVKSFSEKYAQNVPTGTLYTKLMILSWNLTRGLD
jgi:hypothetical protein